MAFPIHPWSAARSVIGWSAVRQRMACLVRTGPQLVARAFAIARVEAMVE
jgi:hypothetical protein